MSKQSSKLHINSLLALLLFAVFAVSILTVLVTGAGVYRRLVERDDDAYTWRTAERYLSAKVHQAGSGSDICIEDFGEGSALTLREEIAGSVFMTRIYCYNGNLCELFHMEGNDLLPEDGEVILPMLTLAGERVDELLFLRMTDLDGAERELVLAARGGEGASA